MVPGRAETRPSSRASVLYLMSWSHRLQHFLEVANIAELQSHASGGCILPQPSSRMLQPKKVHIEAAIVMAAEQHPYMRYPCRETQFKVRAAGARPYMDGLWPGPMKAMPSSSQRRAKSAFSDRKP